MGSDNNWLCPPVCLIVRVIRHIELCRAQRTLVLPLWNSAIFLNVCARDGVHWNSFVVDWVYFPGFICLSSKGYFFQRRPVIFGSRPLNFGVIGLRVNFRRPRPPSSLARFCSTPPNRKCYLCLYTLVMRTFRFRPISFLHLASCAPPPSPPPTFFVSSLFRFLILFFFISYSSHFLFVFSITFGF